MSIDYIITPEETPDSRNEDFYRAVSHNWQKRAKDLRERRLREIEGQNL